MKLEPATAEFLTQELRHLIQNDQNFEVSSSVDADSLDLTVMDRASGSSRGVTLRFTREFLEASEQLNVLEALDQHLRYSLQQGLSEQDQGTFPVHVVPFH